MLNTWIGTGRITRDLELKNTGTGTAVMNFSIAVERPFKNAQGERETDFIDIVAWRATAENISKYFNKGDGIGITGRIQTRNYENNEGRKVYVTEVVADSFDFPIQNKSSNQDGGNQPQQAQQTQQNDNPFADVNSDDPFESNDTDVTDIDSSDLPF